jgi:hypothetical protein
LLSVCCACCCLRPVRGTSLGKCLNLFVLELCALILFWCHRLLWSGRYVDGRRLILIHRSCSPLVILAVVGVQFGELLFGDVRILFHKCVCVSILYVLACSLLPNFFDPFPHGPFFDNFRYLIARRQSTKTCAEYYTYSLIGYGDNILGDFFRFFHLYVVLRAEISHIK